MIGESSEIWIVEDNQRDSRFVVQMLRHAYPGVKVRAYDAADSAKTVLKMAAPTLLVLDLWLPNASGRPDPEAGSLVWREARSQHPSLPIIIRSAMLPSAPSDMSVDGFTRLVGKGDATELLSAVEAVMSASGHKLASEVEVVGRRAVVAGASPWLTRGWILGSLAVAGGLWVVACLPLVSDADPLHNSFFIGMGLLGGLLLGLGRVMRRGEGVLVFFGLAVILAASLVLPQIPF